MNPKNVIAAVLLSSFHVPVKERHILRRTLTHRECMKRATQSLKNILGRSFVSLWCFSWLLSWPLWRLPRANPSSLFVCLCRLFFCPRSCALEAAGSVCNVGVRGQRCGVSTWCRAPASSCCCPVPVLAWLSHVPLPCLARVHLPCVGVCPQAGPHPRRDRGRAPCRVRSCRCDAA